VLAVVDDEEGRATPQVAGDGGAQVDIGCQQAAGHPDGIGDRHQRFGLRGQVDEVGGRSVEIGPCAGDLDGDPRLARAPEPHDAHQTGAIQEVQQARHLVLPTHQRTVEPRDASAGGDGQRGSDARRQSDAEEGHRLRDVAHRVGTERLERDEHVIDR
jgi:hypothetical protein